MRICHIDIETSYIIGAVWGMWEQNVATTLQDPYILGFGYSWNHTSPVVWVGMSDFPKQFKKDNTNDIEVIRVLHKLLNEADVVVAHNGDAFDIKKIRGRFLIHGMEPPTSFKTVDTKKVAKQFGFASNKLDELGRLLLQERKVKHEGIDMWTACMRKDIDEKAWKQMGTYCKQDVALLKKLYNRMLPWITNHPNWNVYSDMPPGCTNCGSGQIVKDGQDYTRTTVTQQYRCMKCKHVMRGASRKMTDIR
jgi:hypothetical protein